jgi:hypothetical protein
VHDARLQQFADKVEVGPNTELRDELGAPMAPRHPRRVPTEVQVHARGMRFVEHADYAWGDPWSEESAMTDDQLREKFAAFSAGVLAPEQAQAILQVLFELEGADDVGPQLMALVP